MIPNVENYWGEIISHDFLLFMIYISVFSTVLIYFVGILISFLEIPL